MESLATFFLGCVSLLALVTLAHFCIMICSMAESYADFQQKYRKSKVIKAYFVFVVIGWFCVVYGGVKMLLFWIPSSLNLISEDGDYIQLRDSIAALSALLSLAFLSRVAASPPERLKSLK